MSFKTITYYYVVGDCGCGQFAKCEQFPVVIAHGPVEIHSLGASVKFAEKFAKKNYDRCIKEGIPPTLCCCCFGTTEKHAFESMQELVESVKQTKEPPKNPYNFSQN